VQHQTSLVLSFVERDPYIGDRADLILTPKMGINCSREAPNTCPSIMREAASNNIARQTRFCVDGDRGSMEPSCSSDSVNGRVCYRLCRESLERLHTRCARMSDSRYGQTAFDRKKRGSSILPLYSTSSLRAVCGGYRGGRIQHPSCSPRPHDQIVLPLCVQ
jgi:hypothetical protein